MDTTKRVDGMRRKIRTIHFVGIGGIGMSGIAEGLLNLGYAVRGSDVATSDITARLSSLGAAVFLGHNAANVGNADVVVTSTAVAPDNPEVVEARRLGVPVIPRAEMLAELLKMKFSIAVSGTHGKTTTTSMISTVLAHAGLDPTMVIGGKLASIGSNAKMGDGEILVAEADESDKSFLKLSPCIAVITNVELEHVDHYRDLEEIKDAFLQFANIVPFYGATVLCSDDANVRAILPEIHRRVITYGLGEDADYRASELSFDGSVSAYRLHVRGEDKGIVTLNVPGRFNVLNSLATVAVARELDVDWELLKAGMALYTGVGRRLEVKGTAGGVTVVDDYGHHPTEIRETLAAARHVWKGRFLVVFQPHRYSRTQGLFSEFTTAFPDADVLIVTDIYAASEKPIPGVHSAALCEAVREQGHPDVTYMKDFGEIVEHLAGIVRPGDTVFTQGAGTVWRIGEALLKRLTT